MAEVLGRVLQALTLLALPMLALALVRARRAGTARPGEGLGADQRPGAGEPVTRGAAASVPRAGLVARGVVGGVLVVGVVGALVAGTGPQVPWTTVAVLALTAVLLRRDERFWVGLAALLPVFSLLGVVAVLVLARGYLTTGGGWSGVGLLVAWGGPVAAPGSAHQVAAVVALGILRMALPLAVATALGWVLTTRQSMGPAVRGALLVTCAAVLGQVLAGPARVAATVVGGLTGQLPFRVAVVGVLVGTVLVLGSVPGAVVGLAVGTARLVRRRDRSTSDAAPVTRLGHGVRPVLRSLRHHVRGPRRWASKLAIVVSVLGVLLLGGLDLSYGLVLDDPGRSTARYVAVDEEIPVPGVVVRAVPGPGGVAWLLTRGGRLETFDPASRALRTLPLHVADARGLAGGGYLAALTTESRPRVVVFSDPDTSTTAVTFDAGSGPSLAVTPTRLYAASRTGDMTVLDSTGKALGEKKIQPLERVVAIGSEVWTLHVPTAVAQPKAPVATSDLVAVRRDPTTLAETAREPVTRSGDRLLWGDSGRAYDVVTGATRPVTPELVAPTPPAAAGGVDAAGRPSLVKTATAPRWTVAPRGTVVLAVGATRTRYALPYDRVVSVVEAPAGTWVVVDEDGVPVSPRSTTRSLVVRWVDPPPR